jgi:hypothetical protein
MNPQQPEINAFTPKLWQYVYTKHRNKTNIFGVKPQNMPISSITLLSLEITLVLSFHLRLFF